MKKMLSFILAVLCMMSCATEKTEKKALVLYFSETGATKTVAEEIKNQIGADIESIEPVTPYTGVFNETMERCNREAQANETPELKPLKSNLQDYDVIYLGYPVWYGTYARPIATLVKQEAFEGKKIVTFCSFGSGGLQTSTNDLKKALPKANIVEGYGVRNARVSAVSEEVTRFLIENGYKEGEVTPLPEFGNQEPVTEAETKIFNDACGDYQFPLGTPITFAKRDINGGTEYKYGVKSQGADGKENEVVIFVVVKDNQKPEFTQVVR